MRAAMLMTAAIGMALSEPATAETLAIEGVYAARDDAALGIREIAFEPFGGIEGEALAATLSVALDRAHIFGGPMFAVSHASFDPRRSGADDQPDRAVMRGSASADVYDTSDGVIEHTRCVRKEKDEDGKKFCVKRVVDVYECRRLNVTYHPRVTLMNVGGILYRNHDTITSSRRYCANESHVPSVNVMLDGLASTFAWRVRLDLVPQQRFNRVRIFESRKGLKGKDRKAFKRAVKLTKSDPLGACLGFENLAKRNPYQRSVLYNLALCHEAEGRLDDAAIVYDHLIRVQGKSQFHAGIARVNSRIRAENQLALHDAANPPLAHVVGTAKLAE